VPDRVTERLREAGPVPPDPAQDDAAQDDAAEDSAVAGLRWLRGPEGEAATSVAAALLAAGVDVLPGLARLRATVGAEHAGPAWELARLRARARPVFGADADVLVLTADTLEQAGRPELASRRAARLLATGASSVADLGCAAGTDTVALARAGMSVVAVDRDPVARELTAANVAALGLADRVRVLAGDVVDLVDAARAGQVAGCGAAVLDPARRAGGRRQLDPDRWSPPWSTVTALLDRVPRSVVKVAPGLDHDRVPAGIEAEWVSVGGSIVEALLWGVGVSETWRRATLVRHGALLELTAAADPGPAPAGPVRGWLHEPDPAAIRSGLMSLVAADLGATLIDPTIAYLSSDAAAPSPWVSSYRVEEVLPFNLKKLKALLRVRGIGRVVVKKRGSPIEPEALVRQLRGPGSASAVVVVTRVAGAPTVLLCDVSG
jgi:SAM-dependent methyltransferase